MKLTKNRLNNLGRSISNDNLEFAILACVRHSLGRRTYSSSICFDLVKSVILHGTDKLIKNLITAILEHGKPNTWILGNPDYGDRCDQDSWHDSLVFLLGEERRRGI